MSELAVSPSSWVPPTMTLIGMYQWIRRYVDDGEVLT